MTLFQECMEYVRTHQIPEYVFGRLAVGDTALINAMRKGREPTTRTTKRVREWMAANPNGVEGVARKQERRQRVPDPVPISAPVFRDPCPRCAVRGDIGCEHQPKGGWQ